MGDVVGLYRGLSVGSIHTYDDLERAFRVSFTHLVIRKKVKTTLLDRC